MMVFGIARIALRGAGGAGVDGMLRGVAGALMWLALAAVATLVFYGVSALREAPAPLPVQTANWMYDRSCGLPGQDFDHVLLDAQQAQQAYYATALNLPKYATVLGADTQAAANCQPTKMRPADRKLYASALFQASTAAKLVKTDPYAMGSHLDAAASQLAAVATRTGEGS